MPSVETTMGRRLETPGVAGWTRTARPDDPNKCFIVSADCHANEPTPPPGAPRTSSGTRPAAPSTSDWPTRIATGRRGDRVRQQGHPRLRHQGSGLLHGERDPRPQARVRSFRAGWAPGSAELDDVGFVLCGVRVEHPEAQVVEGVVLAVAECADARARECDVAEALETVDRSAGKDRASANPWSPVAPQAPTPSKRCSQCP